MSLNNQSLKYALEISTHSISPRFQSSRDLIYIFHHSTLYLQLMFFKKTSNSSFFFQVKILLNAGSISCSAKVFWVVFSFTKVRYATTAITTPVRRRILESFIGEMGKEVKMVVKKLAIGEIICIVLALKFLRDRLLREREAEN